MQYPQRMTMAFALLFATAACGGGEIAESTTSNSTTTSSAGTTTSSSADTTSTTITPTTTLATPTTNSTDECEAAMENIYATVDAILDSVDADPLSFVENDQNALGDLFTVIGETMGQGCGVEGSVDAYSDLLVFISNERADREPLTGSFIEGMLTALCESSPFDLSLPAQAVCVSTGN
ncbi:MAG: hypothetical protein WDZ96_00165 [Acidimicrobiia bacterium]